MSASVAFDIFNLSRNLDTMDAKGPTSRNLQSSWALAQTVAACLGAIQAPGATLYVLSEDWTAAQRTAYETAVDAARVANTTLLTQLKILVKQ